MIIAVVLNAFELIARVYQYILLFRAVMTFLPDSDNPVFTFVYAVTEPVLEMVRGMLSFFGVPEDSPLDMSLIVTMLLLAIILVIL